MCPHGVMRMFDFACERCAAEGPGSVCVPIPGGEGGAGPSTSRASGARPVSGGGGKARASGAVEGIAQDGGAARESRVRYRAAPCPHGRQKSRCKSCGGGSLCSHGRVRSRCKTCGGGSICPHGRERSGCKPCGGGSICEHNRQRSRCKECGGGGICEHKRVRSSCKMCLEAKALEFVRKSFDAAQKEKTDAEERESRERSREHAPANANEAPPEPHATRTPTPTSEEPPSEDPEPPATRSGEAIAGTNAEGGRGREGGCVASRVTNVGSPTA